MIKTFISKTSDDANSVEHRKDALPVGASLLAMMAAHPASICLKGRYREQARSHS
jgi:hypothetical protein